jgi:L-asparaginase
MGVCLIATGGTIASLPDPHTGAVRAAVSAEDLVSSIPSLANAGLVGIEELASVNGWNVTPDTILAVAERARSSLVNEDVDGVVVTHGTDTVEDTAFMCDLIVGSTKPVVFTAAMRSGDEISADGPRNLLAATQVAAAPAARGCGAVLVMNDEVHAARWVRKLDSFRVSAFGSLGHGPLGVLSPAGLRMAAPPSRVNLRFPSSMDRAVPIVQTYTGMEPGVIEAVIAATGADGLVLEGTGLGNLPGGAMAGVAAALERGIPVVVATRVPSGGTSPLYGGPGGGATLQDMGVVSAQTLTAAKARLLLIALLSQGASAATVAEDFSAIVEQLT